MSDGSENEPDRDEFREAVQLALDHFRCTDAVGNDRAHAMANFLQQDGGGQGDAYHMVPSENENNLNKNIRINVIGCYGQGKTTLVRRLLKDNIESSSSTNGIEISNSLFSEKKAICCFTEEICHTNDTNSSTTYKQNKPHNTSAEGSQPEHIRIWDFAGQYLFYATHQIFMSDRAVYLLVFDLSKSLDTKVLDEDFPSDTYMSLKTMEDYIQFWVHSVSTYAGSEDGKEPTIILVGTHLDLLRSEKDADSFFERVRKCIDESNAAVNVHPEHFAISLVEPSEETLGKLRNTILKVGRDQAAESCLQEKWFLFKQAIMAQSADKIISLEKVQQVDSTSKNPIKDVAEIKRCLNFLHKDGTLLYVDEGELAEFIILDPALVVDAFKAVIFSRRFLNSSHLRSLWSNLLENAILDDELLSYVWAEQMNIDLGRVKDGLIGYLKHFRIVAEAQIYNKDWCVTPQGYFIIPSLIKELDDGQIASFMNGKRYTVVSLAFQFESHSPVFTLYPKITAAAIGTWPIIRFNGKQLLFENATVYKMNYCHAGLILKSRGKIELLVISLCPEDDVSPVVSNDFRVFVELIIGHELRGCRKDIGNKPEPVPFTETVRCYHQDHSSKGSIDSYDLNMLSMIKSQGGKMVCCPDHGSHSSLSVDKIFQEWFDYKANERETPVPKTKLTEKEFLTLSRAVGWEWDRLGFELGIRDVTIQHIKIDNHTEQMRILKLFLEWDKQFEDKATFYVLVNALRGIPPYSVDWNIINDLIKRKLE